MAAIATKKRGGDRAVQLTFPLNFQKAYDLPLSYFPSYEGHSIDLMVGADFQSEYHEQKRLEADQSVMNGLQARRTADKKLLTGVHNYHLPKPVLGQRKFANPSNGAYETSSARRDNGVGAPYRLVEEGRSGAGELRGGVRTNEGYAFYRQQLDRRISQLDRMNALAQGYAVELGSEYRTEDNTRQGSANKVEFFVYLRALLDSVATGDLTRFTFENIKEFLSLLFRFAPEATAEDFNDMIGPKEGLLNEIVELLRDGLSPDPEGERIGNELYAKTTLEYMTRAREYVTQMARNVYRQPNERKALSKNLIRSLGFDRGFLRKLDYGDVAADLASGRSVALTDASRRLRDFDGFLDDDGDDDGDGAFDRPAETREDEEAGGMPRAPFAGRSGDPARDRFGRDTGRVIFGGPAYYGEDEGGMDAAAASASARDARPGLVYPLGLSGVDPNAMAGAPEADPESLKRAVEDEVKNVLRPLGFTGSIEEADEFITANYPEAGNFVNEVVGGLEEKTYTPAQIATGMRGTELGVFADYIAENSGSTAPAAAVPARAAGPRGAPIGLEPPVYRGAEPAAAAAAEGAGGYATEEQKQRLYAMGFPRSSSGLQGMSVGAIKTLFARLPEEFGGPIRSTTDVRANLINYVKRKWRQRIDPSW